MKKKNRGKIVSYILLFGISILMLFPFFWMVRSSFMTNREIMTTPIQWLPSHYCAYQYGGKHTQFKLYCLWLFQASFCGKKLVVCPVIVYNDDTADCFDDSPIPHLAGGWGL